MHAATVFPDRDSVSEIEPSMQESMQSVSMLVADETKQGTKHKATKLVMQADTNYVSKHS